MGDLTKIDDPIEIHNAEKNGNLYHHDGYSLNKIEIINENEKCNTKRTENCS